MMQYIITVANGSCSWRGATASRLVRDMGVPSKVAARWERERRLMSPAGLARKLREQRN